MAVVSSASLCNGSAVLFVCCLLQLPSWIPIPVAPFHIGRKIRRSWSLGSLSRSSLAASLSPCPPCAWPACLPKLSARRPCSPACLPPPARTHALRRDRARGRLAGRPGRRAAGQSADQSADGASQPRLAAALPVGRVLDACVPLTHTHLRTHVPAEKTQLPRSISIPTIYSSTPPPLPQLLAPQLLASQLLASQPQPRPRPRPRRTGSSTPTRPGSAGCPRA